MLIEILAELAQESHLFAGTNDEPNQLKYGE
jgi:hypothetical protein